LGTKFVSTGTNFVSYRKINLSDDSHHSSLGPFLVTAGSAAFTAIPKDRQPGSSHLFQCCAKTAATAAAATTTTTTSAAATTTSFQF
jgi:hypothetical protein